MEKPIRTESGYIKYKGFEYAAEGNDSGTIYGEIRGNIEIISYEDQKFSPSRFIWVPDPSGSLDEASNAAKEYAKKIIDSGEILDMLPKRVR